VTKLKDYSNYIAESYNEGTETNEKLIELGYIDLGSYFAYDKDAASNLDWFYHLTGGLTHTDFFAVRPTDYSKANEGEDFEDIW